MRVFTSQPLAAVIVFAVLSFNASGTFAGDGSWSGNTNYFDVAAEWLTGGLNVPPGSTDSALFETANTYQVWWDDFTGDAVQNIDLTVSNGSASFRGTDGLHIYTLTGTGVIDNDGNLALEQMDLRFSDGPVNIGASGNGSLAIDGLSALTATGVNLGAGGQLSVTGGDFTLAATGPALLNNTGGAVSIDNNAQITALNPDAQIIVNGGVLAIRSSRIDGVQSIVTQVDPADPARGSLLQIEGSDTIINLDAQSPNGFTGLSIGFGGNTEAVIFDGARVNIGESGMAGVPSGLVVGSNWPTAIGGPFPGATRLRVEGPGTAIDITGGDILAGVGTSTPAKLYFEALGIPGVDTLPSDGVLEIENGAAVRLTVTGGGFGRFIVADHAGGRGEVYLRNGGVLNAANLFTLGADEGGVTGGDGYLEIGDDSRLIADRVVIGGTSEARVQGPGARIESTTDGASAQINGELVLESTGSVSLTGAFAALTVTDRLMVHSDGRVQLGQNGSVFNDGGESSFDGGHLQFLGTDGNITVDGGRMYFETGATVINGQSLTTQGRNANLVINGAGTVVDLTAQSTTSFTGLLIGFGGDSQATVSGGAVVNIGTSGPPVGPGTGLTIGAGLPTVLGGPDSGNGRLHVTGAGSRVVIEGESIAGSIGSTTGIADFLEQAGVPGVDSPPAFGELIIDNGGAVTLDVSPGGTSLVRVADAAGSFGLVRVASAGVFDAGNNLELGVGGVDEFGVEIPGGTAQLEVLPGGGVVADHLNLGTDAAVSIDGAGASISSGSDDGSIQVNGGQFRVLNGGLVSFNGANNTLTVGSGQLDVLSGGGINFADAGFISINGGNARFDDATVSYNGAGTGGISVNGGQVRIQNNTQVSGMLSLGVQGPGSTIIVDGPGTFVDLSGQSTENFTGVSAGLGGDNAVSITNGARVLVGESGLPGFASGFGAGSELPDLLGGPLGGSSTLTVDGAGSSLLVQGSLIGGGIGSSTALIAFLEPIVGIPLPNPGGNGRLFVTNGGQVILDEAPGGASTLLVADSTNASGEVHVSGGGALLDAGQRFALGVDAADNTAGQGLLRIETGGRVETDRLIVGGNSMVQLHGGTLAVESIEVSADSLLFEFGTLEFTGTSFSIAAGQLLGDVHVTEAGRNVVVINDALVHAGSVLRFEADTFSAGRILNNGDIEIAGPKVATGTGLIENFGRIVGSGRVGAELDNAAGGEVRILAGQELAFTETGNRNAGEINILGGTAQFSHTLDNLAGGFIGGRGVLATDGLINGGVIAFSADSDILGDVSQFGGGQIVASGASVLTLFDDVLHNGFEIRASAGSTVVVLGSYAGAGALTGGGDFFLEGDLNPGNSPGLMNVDGDLNFGSLLDTTMEIGGLARGTEYDAIDVTGDLTLSGFLTIALYDSGGGPFSPSEGDSFDLFNAGTLSGTFLGIDLPGLQAGLRWDLAQLEVNGVLSVAAVPVPPALWLFGGALVALVRVRRRP